MHVLQTGYKVYQDQGFLRGLYRGLSASLLRQATYTTARMGFYMNIKQWISKKNKNKNERKCKICEKIFAGMTAGMIGAFIGSPADLVLVRMQADGRLPPEQRRNYKHAFDGLYRIYKEEGLPRMWRGSGPNVIRAMLMTAGQVSSYDQAKESLLKTGYFKDGIVIHFVASSIASFIATVICNPADVIKTRVMNKGGNNSTNSVQILTNTLRNEGFRALYRGFWPFFMKLAPQTIIIFLTYEQLAKLTKKLNNY